MPEIAALKRSLRSEMRSRLAALPPGRGHEVGQRVATLIESVRIWPKVRAVAVYKAMAAEVDLDPLAQRAWASGRVVLLPRMERGRRLVFHEWRATDRLRVGPHGVLEPESHRTVRELEEVELVLVPGLAFDQRGGRLGRGAGYYDRALAGLSAVAAPPLTLGVGFSVQIVEAVPTTSLDIPLSGVVTEEGLIDPACSISRVGGVSRHEES